MSSAHDIPDDRQAAVGTGPLSGELLRHVLTVARAGAWSWNFVTQQNVWSEEAYRLFGIPPGTPITPDIFYGCLHPDDREAMRATIAAALAGRAPLEGEHRACWPDGSVHWLRNVGGVERDTEGRPVRMSGVVLDVTVQRDTELRLRAAEARLSQTLTLVNAGVFEWEPRTRTGYWSDHYYRQHGLEPSQTQLSPDRLLETIHPDDRAAAADVVQRVLAGANDESEHRVVHPDGSVHWLRDTVMAIRDASGEVIRISGLTLDVTTERQAQAELRDAQLRSRFEADRVARTLASLNAGTFEWSAATGAIAWSDELYRMHGLTPGEIPATREATARLVHPDDRAALDAFYEQAIRTESRFEFEHRVVWRNGTVRWLRNLGSIERDGEGRPQRIIGIVLDVTDKRDAVLQLRTAEARLARTVKLLNTGVFEIDLRTGFTYWSDENYRLLGLEPGSVEPSAELFLSRIHPEDRARNRDTMRRAIAGEAPLDDTHRIVRDDGSMRWMRGTGVVVRDEQGVATAISGITLDVTDAMQSGIARQETADRLSRTLLALKAGVWEIDLHRGTAYWSDENFRVLGLEPGAIEPSIAAFIGVTHPDDRVMVREAFRGGLADGDRLAQIEHRIVDADGRIRWVNHQGVVFRDEHGAATSLWGISIDVSNRREAEDAVQRARLDATRRSEAQASVSRALSSARTLDDALPAVMEAFGTQLGWDCGEVWLQDPATARLRFSTAWMREGYDVSPYVEMNRSFQFQRGQGIVGCVWRDGQAQWVVDVQDDPRTIRKDMARAAGIRTAFAVPIIRRSGVVGVVQFLSASPRQPDDEIVNMFGSLGSQLGEFMERVATSAALRDSERQLRSVIETALDAVVGIDSRGHIVDWNPQAERIFGWTVEDVRGRLLEEVIIPEVYREAHRAGMAHYRATGSGPVLNTRIELEALHRDGHVFPVEFSIAVLHPWQPAEAGGEWAAADEAVFSAFIRDISERRRAEQAMLQARDQAEATARAKSDFLAVMSHEIRTPLNGVMGMLNLLLKTDLNAAQREQLQTALRSADILLAVTNDALDFSKIEAGRLVIEQTPFDLDQLLDDVMGSVRPQVAPGVELRIAASGQRPGAVIGDPTRLRQILVNLLGNAAKFTSAGHVALRVEAGVPQEDGAIPFLFLVEDTGIGIPGDKQTTIFEAFTQAESSTTRRYGGTGLGLPIARQLAHLMDGTLRLARSSADGSVFELTLLLRPATVARSRTQAQRVLSVTGHVLVVDDNQVNRDIASAMLRHAGCTVAVAFGGADALLQIAQQPFDLVFMDCQMPDMDGYETTRTLRARGYTPERLPVVAMTAAALAEDRERSFAAGMNDHLSKPVLEDALLEVLGRWLPHADVAPERSAEPAGDVDLSVIFNVKTVLRTRELMDEIPGSWDAMVESFVSHGRSTLDRLATEVGEARFDAVRRTAHNIKGTAAMIGAVRLSAWSADLEMAAQDSRTVLCSRLYLRLREEFDAVAQALQANAF